MACSTVRIISAMDVILTSWRCCSSACLPSPSGIHGKQGSEHKQEPVLHHLREATTFEQRIYRLWEGKVKFWGEDTAIAYNRGCG